VDEGLAMHELRLRSFAFLEAIEYEVMEASNGRQGLERTVTHRRIDHHRRSIAELNGLDMLALARQFLDVKVIAIRSRWRPRSKMHVGRTNDPTFGPCDI
jgi:hypothetical protein